MTERWLAPNLGYDNCSSPDASSPVGAGLLAKAVDQPTLMFTDMTPSRASPLPQFVLQCSPKGWLCLSDTHDRRGIYGRYSRELSVTERWLAQNPGYDI